MSAANMAVPAQRPSSGAWRVLAFLWVAYLINYVDRQAVFSVFPMLRQDLGFSETQLGLVGSMFLWVYSVCSPVAGHLADRLPRERMIVFSLCAWSLATFATGFSRSVETFLFWRAVVGVTEGLYFPFAVSAIGSLHPPATRSRAISTHGLAQFAGIALGGWFGGWSAETWGWRWGFAALGILGLLYAPILGLGLRAPLRSETNLAAGKPAPGELLRSPAYWALAVAFSVLCFLLWMLYAWLPSLIFERFHLGLAESGFTATIYLQGSSAIGILGGATLADRASRRFRGVRFTIVAAGLAVAGPCAYATFAAGSLGAFRLACIGFGLAAGAMMGNVIASAYDVISRANYGLAAGGLTLAGGLAGGLGSLAVGGLRNSVGTESVAAAGGLAAMAAAAILLITVRCCRPERSRYSS